MLPVVAAGRRRTLGRCLAAVSALCGGLSVLGSFLPWTYIGYGDGDSSQLAIGGLSQSEWGVGTLLIGIALILTGLSALLYASRIRFLVPALVAAGGLALTAHAAASRIQLDTGEIVGASPHAGLLLVLAAYSVAVASILLMSVLDWRWYGPETMTQQLERRTTPPRAAKPAAQ